MIGNLSGFCPAEAAAVLSFGVMSEAFRNKIGYFINRSIWNQFGFDIELYKTISAPMQKKTKEPTPRPTGKRPSRPGRRQGE